MARIIRPQTIADADGKGYVHYQSWQETYSAFMDAGFLRHQSLEKCQQIARSHPENTLVAEVDGEIVGFVCPVQSREDANTGEIQALYVLRRSQGLGIGRALMEAALEQLARCPAVTLWVLKGNDNAIAFYEHMGFRYEGVRQTLPGTGCEELQMVLRRQPGIQSIEKKTDNRFLNFYEFQVRHRGQSDLHPYYVASRATKIQDLKAVSHQNRPDGVVLFGVYGPRKDRIVLLRQYRYPLGGYCYELPAGLVEPGENMLDAGIREMYEETGLTFAPREGGSYSRPFFTTIGMTDESCGTVYGYCSGEPTSRHQESSEDIQVILADRAECRRILREENVAIMCAYQLMHFIASEGDPLDFLNA